ncbi:tripartite tricarboxylate transporter substrate-binding protein [Ottowia sp.]|uniref:Bug family tripartite tricarboxylate transporter substrate binding protein n=1 Tax=Ottowia sp. TaxID=1898956 RepID=UPI002C0D9BC8|nr:tripartite tricarboxylate transporter substrate-binding protein [Ottowia sp.]HRN74374.1 tripartite tricarboxylate transporter substrate-binding protein [Ottowia sp.]HRQ01266.1 tripartite tricarboxylate transporter substrate-binding protein [Ottowia sp.]
MTQTPAFPSRRRFARCMLALAAAATSFTAVAQANYPTRPITLVVPFAAGGATDIVARIVADKMRSIGQSVVVDNKAGAGGMIGAQAVAKAKPDGYTIGMGTVSTLAVNPVLLKSYKMDPAKDFAPITALVVIPTVVSAGAGFPVKNFDGFLAEVRKQPDHYNAGSPGIGSIGHLVIEAMNEDLKIQLRHIPYKGMGPAITSALSGETQVLSDQYPSSASHIKAGKLTPLFVGANARLPELPQVPTLKELGYPELNELAITWFGLVAPAGTPAEIVSKLNAAAVAALKDPATQARLKDLNAQTVGNTPEAFGQMIAQAGERVRRIAQSRKIEAE